ncbi:hypothetical protein HMPREF0653_01648 [Prevotella disiens JCM 6334 = ATCC 29426]|uniref:Uncharacterized protein n=1 Tax=Prevotella disiens JCM 6334 = ATCC 29426 TaxID=1235811 RepID=A0ABN0NRD8_9BACT|nr:hypothetical protein HMPREF0653_01648 [Prevotella disiens JCM 6334 = ATCC 29426]
MAKKSDFFEINWRKAYQINKSGRNFQTCQTNQTRPKSPTRPPKPF